MEGAQVAVGSASSVQDSVLDTYYIYMPKKILTHKQQESFQKRILKVLREQSFILDEREMDLIKRRSNNSRYFFMVAKRIEDGKQVDRFIKIPQNKTKLLLGPFERQIKFAEYIKNHTNLKTRGIIKYNLDNKKGMPFAIIETFPSEKSKIGFIEGSDKVEMLGVREAKNIIHDLEVFHSIDFNKIPKELKKVIRIKTKGKGFDYVKKSVKNSLSFKVFPLDSIGNKKILVHKLLEKRTGIKDFKKIINETLNKIESRVNEKRNAGRYVIHGDMAPNNLYVYDNGEVEFLDLEWVSLFENRIVAMVYDFGNMRIRSWKNKKFREALDSELIRVYKERGEEDVARLIIGLSILRSNVIFSSFFENYPWDKQMLETETERRKVAEEEIKMIWQYI